MYNVHYYYVQSRFICPVIFTVHVYFGSILSCHFDC